MTGRRTVAGLIGLESATAFFVDLPGAETLHGIGALERTDGWMARQLGVQPLAAPAACFGRTSGVPAFERKITRAPASE